MSELIMVKLEDGLHPTDAEGQDAMKQVPEGSYVKVKFSVPRSVRQLRLFFALINLLFEHQLEPRRFPTRDALREGLLIAVGHCHQVRNPLTNAVYIVPNSISFGSMDNVAFRELFEAVKNLIVERILPGIGKRELEQQVADMLREPGPDQLERIG